MALPRRRTRPICVAGVRLRWVDAFLDHEHGDHALVVQAADGAGAKLIVLLPWHYFRRDCSIVRPLRPGWVARCIHQALRHGWTPEHPGPDLRLALDDLLPAEPLPPTAHEIAQEVWGARSAHALCQD